MKNNRKSKLILGSGIRPSDKDFFKITKQQYKKSGDPQVNNYKLVYDSPTVKAYLDQGAQTIILAIRGTDDLRDVKADAQIALNRLKNSDRYNLDKNIIQQIIQAFPPQQYDYFLTGHSLGGAIINQLKRDFPFLKDSVQFNPAFQPYDLFSQQATQNKRYYTQDDPLYNMGGRFFSNEIVVPTQKTTIQRPSNIASQAFNYYQGHALDNFNTVLGGMKIKNSDIIMKKKDFVKEHKNLINLLDKVNKEKLEQKDELNKVMKKIKGSGFLNDLFSKRQLSDKEKEAREKASKIGSFFSPLTNIIKDKIDDKKREIINNKINSLFGSGKEDLMIQGQKIQLLDKNIKIKPKKITSLNPAQMTKQFGAHSREKRESSSNLNRYRFGKKAEIDNKYPHLTDQERWEMFLPHLFPKEHGYESPNYAELIYWTENSDRIDKAPEKVKTILKGSGKEDLMVQGQKAVLHTRGEEEGISPEEELRRQKIFQNRSRKTNVYAELAKMREENPDLTETEIAMKYFNNPITGTFFYDDPFYYPFASEEVKKELKKAKEARSKSLSDFKPYKRDWYNIDERALPVYVRTVDPLGLTPEQREREKKKVQELEKKRMEIVKRTFGYGKPPTNYKIHAIVIKKPYDLQTAKAEARSILKIKKDKFMRETEGSYRFRNIPKTKFNKESFRTQKVNPNISIIWGILK